MSKPAIEVKNLSKVYNIGHERKSSAGTVTLRDAITNVVRKPAELVTGHKLKKEKFWALRDINVDIQPGDVVGIIGRNGSGKSTLLKVMSRIVEPTNGEIIMRGKTASLLEVGTGFHPELTGRENIYFNGSILGMKKKEIEAKFEEIVAFSEVEKFLDTPVKFYSSGMYVRLAFAVAAHLEPDILIVDEVLAVGDAAFQKKCLGKMKDVAGQGRTVIFVSHNMPSVLALCSKVAVMKAGELTYFGDTMVGVDKYQTEAVPELKRQISDKKTHFKTLTVKQVKDNINIEAKLNIAELDLGSKLVVGFGIEDSLHNRIATFVSDWDGVSIDSDKKLASIFCNIKNPPLVSGPYYISASVSIGGATLDYIDGGATITYSSPFDVESQRTVDHGSINISHQIGTRDV